MKAAAFPMEIAEPKRTRLTLRDHVSGHNLRTIEVFKHANSHYLISVSGKYPRTVLEIYRHYRLHNNEK
jgi:hypothetical protein